MGSIVTWQDLAVAAIVGWAVVWLYRHMRGMLSVPPAKADASGGRGFLPRLRRLREEATPAPNVVKPR